MTFPQSYQAQSSCGTDGSIKSGSSLTLNPNSDGFFTIYSGSGFSSGNNEFLEFEDLTHSGGANRGWTRLNGTDPNSDLLSGGGCGNTDIVTDTDGGSDYAYYSIVDPDGTADNGDEFLAFALRIADKTNGAFGFSFLVDADNNCSTSDGNAVCGNPCFEYEIQLSTSNSGGTVKVYDIDGCYGTSDCTTAHGALVDLCGGDCNTDALQVCAGGTACPSGDPVFWVFYIDFTDLPGLNSTDNFSITPGSNTSGNAIIYKSANVSDYGGVDDLNDLNTSCDCSTQCSGSSCSKCEQDCLLSCAAENNGFNVPFPVTWSSVSVRYSDGKVGIHWDAFESGGVMGYHVERAFEGSAFQEIGWQGAHNRTRETSYLYQDFPQQPGRYRYRLVSEDFDGTLDQSPTVETLVQTTSRLTWDASTGVLSFFGTNLKKSYMSICRMDGASVWSEEVINKVFELDPKTLGLAPGYYLARLEEENFKPLIIRFSVF